MEKNPIAERGPSDVERVRAIVQEMFETNRSQLESYLKGKDRELMGKVLALIDSSWGNDNN